MAEQPHVRLYRGLPPVVRPRRGRWSFAAAVIAIAVPAIAVAQAVYAPRAPSNLVGRRPAGEFVPPFDRYSLIWIGVPFIVGGVLGVALVRGWWTMFAVDAVGLAIGLALTASAFSVFYRDIYGGFFWVFGVSAGVGLRGFMHRRRLRASTFGVRASVGISHAG